MDFLDILINFFNVTDNSNLIKINFEKFTDKNEYFGERIKSFVSFTIMILCIIALVFGIAFLIYKLLKDI
ncbi:hypothetical protein EV144_10555 [Flavobacterium sp. 270]|nr:hypothetical protein EV144_10555 [Flavobacterium sp. 270]